MQQNKPSFLRNLLIKIRLINYVNRREREEWLIRVLEKEKKRNEYLLKKKQALSKKLKHHVNMLKKSRYCKTSYCSFYLHGVPHHIALWNKCRVRISWKTMINWSAHTQFLEISIYLFMILYHCEPRCVDSSKN